MARRATGTLWVLAGVIALGGCVDEDVVFDRPIFQGMVGEAGATDSAAQVPLTMPGGHPEMPESR